MEKPEKTRKKRRGRWAYLEDFQQNLAGEYIYTGAHYAYADAAGRSRRRLLTGLWLSAGLAAVAVVIQGFLPAGGMFGCFYVVAPYAGALLSICSVLWALVRLSANREPLRAYIYTATVRVLPLRCILAACFIVVTLVGDGVFLLINGMPDPAVSLSFLGLGLLALLSMLAGLRWRRGANWTRIDPEA